MERTGWGGGQRREKQGWGRDEREEERSSARRGQARSDTHQRDRRRCREEELSSPAYFVSEKQQTELE